MKSRMLLWMIALLLTVDARLSVAQAPPAGNYSPAQYDVEERHDVSVSVRDGTKLSVDLYIPRSAETHAVLLNIWPYDNSDLRSWALGFASRGYAVATVDSRGRYDSEGTFDPEDPQQKTDGYDLVEWLAKQPWSNGKIGMIGGSYAGRNQWWTASTAPPHLVAIAPECAPPDAFENFPYQNGVLTGEWVFDWAALMSGRTMQNVGAGPYGGWGGHIEDLKHTPYEDINSYRGNTASWFHDWYSQNRSTDARWARIAYQTPESYSKMAVASVSVTGWFDANYPGGPMNYSGMKKYGATPDARRPALIIGPWTHWNYERVTAGIDYGPEAAADVTGYLVRWFDHYLKGVDNGVEKDPRVYLFVMGENRWHAEDDWPVPDAKPTRYYLTSGGQANSLKGDGALTLTLPRKDGSDHYIYDPRTPTRDPFSSLPNHNGQMDGELDTRLSAIGDEVLVYQTPPLDSPVEVIGPIEATLYAATSARDTDWMIRLVDVEPDGRSLLLADGTMRARNRDASNDGEFNAASLSILEPNTIYRYVIRFWRGTANLFATGHRIRVEISSSWYPYFLPNLNTGADNLASVSISQAVVAHQAVYHGPSHPSYILLPMVPVVATAAR